MVAQLPPGFAQIAQLIQQDPELVAQKAAEAGLLPPSLSDVLAESTPLPSGGGLPPISGQADVGIVPSPPAVPLAPGLAPAATAAPASAAGGPNTAAFLQALQGVQAPPAPAVPRLGNAPGVPAGRPLPAGIGQLLQLFAAQQDPALQSTLGRLILGR